MLKRRIIPVQLLSGGRLVKTRSFEAPRDVGDPVASAKVYSAQQADELVFLNIDREARTIAPMMELIERVSAVAFMPLAVGGGIRAFEDAEALLRHGADKVIVNSVAYRDRSVVARIAERFGSQAVVVAIDVRRDDETGRAVLYSDCGRVREADDLSQHVDATIEAGAGEIFVQSIDRDGTMSGYDLPLLAEVSERSTVPVIGCGGAGNYEHMRDAFVRTNVRALACGSLFNFGDNNPMRAKAFLGQHGLAFKKV
jgi:imidazole glycerol-phosphate synthase subunit HisF